MLPRATLDPMGGTSDLLTAQRELEPTVTAPRLGRAFLRSQLGDWNASEFEDPATIVLTELVNNVVQHARTVIDLRASWDGDALRVEVRDGSSVVPAMRDLADDDHRGLRMVDGFSSAWGTEQLVDGKSVWFCIRREDLARFQML